MFTMARSKSKTILLILLLFFIDVSVARVLRVQEGKNHANPIIRDEGIGEMEMRKLIEMEAMVDYEKDPHPNPKHEPPKN